MRSPGRGLLFAASLACALAACMVDRAPGLYASSVSYAMRFDRSGIDALEGGGARIITAEGRAIELRRGHLLQSSMTLVDCLGVGSDVWGSMGSLFSPAIAYAGHGEASDASAVIAPRFVDLVSGAEESLFGSSAMAEQRYCRVHHLVAGTLDPAAIADVPEGVDPVATTLVLEGAYEQAGEWIDFDVRSTLSSGVLHDLPDVVEGPLEGSHASVVVERDLAHMFDDVDFDDDPGRQVLRNLVIDARVRVLVQEM